MNFNPSYQVSAKDGPVYDNAYEVQNQQVENIHDKTVSITPVQKSVNKRLRCLQFATIIVSIVAVTSLLMALAAVTMTFIQSGDNSSSGATSAHSPNGNASGESLIK